MEILIALVFALGVIQISASTQKSTPDVYRDMAIKNPEAFWQTIAPGTKWCGDGDIAQHENDFGNYVQTDMCCRDHDYCDDIIPKGQSKYGLRNDGQYTRLHCKCDNKFLNCLRASNDNAAVSLGFAYFTVLGERCYAFRYPATCKQYLYQWEKRRCVEYSYNTNLPKKWQWFDLKPYPLS